MTQRDAIAFYVRERDASYYSSTGSANGNQSVGKAVNDRGLCRCLSYRVVELEHAGTSAHKFCNNRRQRVAELRALPSSVPVRRKSMSIPRLPLL